MGPRIDTVAASKDRDRTETARRPVPTHRTDPFYAESDQRYLRQVIADIESGRSVMKAHDLLDE